MDFFAFSQTIIAASNWLYRFVRYENYPLSCSLSYDRSSAFQSKFSRQSDLVLPLSIYSIFSCPRCYAVAAYLFFLVFVTFFFSIVCSIACCRRQFLRKMWPVNVAFLYFSLYTMLSSSLTSCITSQFFTRPDQMCFYILLQHHISKPSRHLWSTIRSFRFSAPWDKDYHRLQLCLYVTETCPQALL